MVLQPVFAKSGDGDLLKAEGGWGADFKLGVNLGGKLASRFSIRADAWTASPPVFVIAEIPDAPAPVGADLADAKRRFASRHVILREPSRHKTPQKPPQTGISEDISKRQRPMCQALMTHRPAGKRRGRDSNPRYTLWAYTAFPVPRLRPLGHRSSQSIVSFSSLPPASMLAKSGRARRRSCMRSTLIPLSPPPSC